MVVSALMALAACHNGHLLRSHVFASGEASASVAGFWIAPTTLEITDRTTQVGLRLYNDSPDWMEVDLSGMLLVTDDATYPVLGYSAEGEELGRRSLTLAPGERTEILVVASPTHPPLEALRLESRAQRRGEYWLEALSVQLSTPVMTL